MPVLAICVCYMCFSYSDDLNVDNVDIMLTCATFWFPKSLWYYFWPGIAADSSINLKRPQKDS